MRLHSQNTLRLKLRPYITTPQPPWLWLIYKFTLPPKLVILEFMKTRIAPSPTGYLHLGHAYSAWLTVALAKAMGLGVVLRLEDIDHTRCKPAYVAAIAPDLAAIGLMFAAPLLKQSTRFGVYAEALQKLENLGLLYPCTCTRAEMAENPEALYNGACRHKTRKDIPAEIPYALRLNVGRAVDFLRQKGRWPLHFTDATKGRITATPELLGDVVLARKEFATSYHLSVVCDDAAQNISHIIRGADLFEMTHIHRLLQALLDLPTPQYIHHGLVVEAGKQKLSKSAAATPLRDLIKQGLPLADLQNVFEHVRTIADEPKQKFIDALPPAMAAELRFSCF